MNKLSLIAMLVAGGLGIDVHADGSALRSELASKDGWIGYHVPAVKGSGSTCCYSGKPGGTAGARCDLDTRKGTFVTDDRASSASGDLAIYWHVTNGRPDQVRAFSADCPVTSQQEVRWIDPVDARESVAATAEWMDRNDKRRDSEGFPALALQAHVDATAALIALAAPSRPLDSRKEAIFWLGQARGADGANFVEKVAAGDASPDLREHAVFALSESNVDDAYERVRAISKKDASGDVRGKALFWMAQMEDPRAVADISAALSSETSEDVREEAVFALSQLEDAAATAALIAVIRGNHPRAVKEKALFWLGQAGTDEAMAFMDAVLTE